MKIKWIMAIVIIFGVLTMFYILQMTVVLKPLLVLLCFILIGCVLLQSGKGGGLAAIGGLADQSAFGTQTSSVLSKVTYLIGAAFIFNVILLTKLTLVSMHDSGSILRTTEMMQEAAQIHEDAGRGHEGHDHAQSPHEGVVDDGGSMGMKAIDTAKDKNESNETGDKLKAEEGK